MRTTATMSAILAASALTQAAIVTTEPQITSTVVSPSLLTGNTVAQDNGTTVTIPSTSVPFPILSTASGSPIPSANSSGILPTGTGGTGGTGRPPVPTSSTTTGPTAGPTAGAALTNTQNSWLAMGIAVVMASVML